jgi:hypothetical protein
MSEVEFAKLGNDLDGLGQRIEKRVQELKNTGRFPEEFERAANEIRARRQQQRDRVTEAIRSGSEWKILTAELMRDYNSLADTFCVSSGGLMSSLQKIKKGSAHFWVCPTRSERDDCGNLGSICPVSAVLPKANWVQGSRL